MTKISKDIYVGDTGKTLESLTKIVSFEFKDFITDLNDATSPGIYFFNEAPPNSPCYNGWLMVLNSPNYSIKQVVFRYGSFNGNNHFNTYIRTHFSNGWTEWYKIC
jgi:hypothetical protein